MNYSVYVLKSKINGKRYVGYTSKDPIKRLKEHNFGNHPSTKPHIPYKLIYYESDYCKTCAIHRENFLKSGRGRKYLDAIEKSL